jgi:heat shock protein HspQ
MGNVIQFKQSRFAIGELVHHRLFDYRGVIFDIDPDFRGSDEWYESIARSRPPKDEPWYHVLVNGENHTTYVAERNLERTSEITAIDHPLLEHYFSDFKQGRYIPRRTGN